MVDFSDGYYKAGLLILVHADENTINSVEDLNPCLTLGWSILGILGFFEKKHQ